MPVMISKVSQPFNRTVIKLCWATIDEGKRSSDSRVKHLLQTDVNRDEFHSSLTNHYPREMEDYPIQLYDLDVLRWTEFFTSER
jgi:hypothetical protein